MDIVNLLKICFLIINSGLCYKYMLILVSVNLLFINCMNVQKIVIWLYYLLMVRYIMKYYIYFDVVLCIVKYICLIEIGLVFVIMFI